jgi:hypothetical protein
MQFDPSRPQIIANALEVQGWVFGIFLEQGKTLIGKVANFWLQVSV